MCIPSLNMWVRDISVGIGLFSQPIFIGLDPHKDIIYALESSQQCVNDRFDGTWNMEQHSLKNPTLFQWTSISCNIPSKLTQYDLRSCCEFTAFWFSTVGYPISNRMARWWWHTMAFNWIMLMSMHLYVINLTNIHWTVHSHQ